MTNAIIGASGDMGKNLLSPLLKKLGPVILIDKNSGKRLWDKAWDSDAIWFSVPRNEIPKILNGRKLKKNQLIVDICSLKQGLEKIVAKTGAQHLSLHPLQGPFVPLASQKWVVIKARKTPEINKILKFLTSQKIRLVNSASEKGHDFMIGLNLGVAELLTVIIEMLLESQKVPGSSKKLSTKEMFNWSTPALTTLLGFYIHVINSTPVWLRKELAFKSGDKDFLKRFKQVLINFADKPEQELNLIMESQASKANKGLAPRSKQGISKLINQAYIDLNALV